MVTHKANTKVFKWAITARWIDIICRSGALVNTSILSTYIQYHHIPAGYHREHLQLNPVKLVKVGPGSSAGQTLEELAHWSTEVRCMAVPLHAVLVFLPSSKICTFR